MLTPVIIHVITGCWNIMVCGCCFNLPCFSTDLALSLFRCFFFIITFTVYLWMGLRMHVGTHTCPGKHVNVRGQLAGVSALQPRPEGKIKVVRLGAKYFYPRVISLARAMSY